MFRSPSFRTANGHLLYGIRVARPRCPSTAAPGSVVAYIRVSTDEQANSGAGMEAQRAAISAEVARRGWTVFSWHADEGISGGKGVSHRPGLAAAIGAVESGDAAALMAAKLDRISRSVLDTASLMEQARQSGWELITCDLAIDTSTPAGEATASMMAVFSQLERRLISQRTREALAIKRAQGIRLGRPSALPLEVVRRIVERRARGDSLRIIAAGLENDGVPTAQGGAKWHASTIKAVIGGQDAVALAW
ncbi:resolvase domain-containing protein [Mycobacteroides abscessus subsp. bolletii]|uniref:recombinase family protein n=1 Tax=Mycobacteroides abscessus TaxID=36809 RepID=UPI0009A8A0B2|nr:recombinase family protein [Mycobacteroides abscessus]SKG75035.1 resolvase domain-containing protein [Mycobacteroides abscessus subsp. bolletii]SKH26063.1 resolvase domain-containing protein [Mycobacteroides abscessus subsp. bolletii]